MGKINLAIAAYFKKLPNSFKVKTLGQDPHVCVGKKQHPYFKSKQTLTDYLNASHIKIDVPPGRQSAIDKTLEEQNKERRIIAHISNFFTPPLILSSNDVLLTCPETLAKNYSKHYNLEVAPLPLKTNPIEIKMVWHSRNHNDQFHRWVRTLLSK